MWLRSRPGNRCVCLQAATPGRWVADHVSFKDALKTGEGTEFVLDSLRLNVPIPDYIFSKASLKK